MRLGAKHWGHTGRRVLLCAAISCLVAGMAGCSHSPSVYRNRIRLSTDGKKQTITHVVAPGETLAGLARLYGVPIAWIARENNLANPDKIFAGQRLTITATMPARTDEQDKVVSAGTPGVYHSLAPGETLMSLERAYGVRAGVLKRVNNIADEHSLRVGQRIFVPGAKKVVHPRTQVAGQENLPYRSKVRTAAVSTIERPPTAVASSPVVADSETNIRPPVEPAVVAPPAGPLPPPVEAPASQLGFIHPLAGRGSVSSRFGDRGDEFHYGVDISASEGTPVYAAGAGTVEYVGSPRDPLGKTLGNFLMVYHPNSGLRSLYGHCSRIHVRSGQTVKRGQVIAEVGHTGRVRGPTGDHLHLEIRNEEGIALDPMRFIPGLR